MHRKSRRNPLPLLIAVLAAGLWSCPPVWGQDAMDVDHVDTQLDAAPEVDDPTQTDAADDALQPPTSLRLQRVRPLTREALERAKLPLADAVAKLPLPDYLKVDPDAADQTDAEPKPESLKAYVAARAAYRQSDLSEAMKQLQLAVQRDPTVAAPYLLLGRIYTEVGDKKKAAAAYIESARRDPADPDALFRLGQLAYEQGAWAESAVNMARTRQSERSLDPGIGYMADYFLGQALLRTGYDAAAAEPLTEFLREPERFSRSTRYLRQARVLGRQRRAVTIQLGDAMMRLGRFDEAVKYYTDASAESDISLRLLAPRMVYAFASADRFADAEQYVIDLFASDDNLATAADLADYLVTVHPQSKGINDALVEAYRDADRPEGVAKAMAKLLAGDERAVFLIEHLQHQPTHVALYELLVDELVGRDLNRLMAVTLDVMKRAPVRADQVMTTLLDRRIEPAKLLDAFEALPLAQRVSEVGWFARGMIALDHDDAETADEAFTKSLDRNPDFTPAQAAAMRLMIARGQTQRVLELGSAYGNDAPAQIRHLIAIAKQHAGRHADAITDLGRLVAEFPDQPDYLMSYAASQQAVGNFAEAEAKLAKAIQLDPQLESAYEALFDIYEKHQPDAQKYRQLLAAARQAIPNGRVTRIKTARLYAAVGDVTKAELLLRDVIADHPTDEDALRELAGLLGRADRWADMLSLLEELLDEDPANLAALDTLRSVARINEQPDRFYSRYETYLRSRPTNRPTTERLAKLYEDWDKPEQSLEQYDRLIEMSADNAAAVAQYQVRAAGVLNEAKRTDEAMARMDRAIAAGDQGRTVLYKVIKASMLAEAERTDEAVVVLNKAIVSHADQSDTLRLELARILAMADKVEEALAQIDKVIANKPGQAADLYYMQSSLLHGKQEAAELYEKVLLRALEADPNHAPSNNDLGYTWVEQGKNLAKAEQMIRKAVAVEGDSAAYLDSLGWVLYKRGKFAEAAAWLNKARQAQGGDDPIILDHLGDALWRAGRTDDAVTIWQATLARLTQQGDAIDDYYKPLLPKLRQKLRAADAGEAVPVAAVPRTVNEEKPPDLPVPQMQ